MRRTSPIAVLALLVTSPSPAHAQSVVRVEVGASSASDAYGARAEWYHARFDASLGLLGFQERALGGHIHTRWHGYDAAAGDLWLSNALPSDRFGGGWSVLGRGLAAADSAGRLGWTAFAGWSARARSLVPGLVTATGRKPLGFLELRWSARPTLAWGLRETLTGEGWSHLQFGTWKRESLRLDGSWGRLQGEAYGALALTLKTPSLEVDASWTDPPAVARRVASREVTFPELTGINARAAWRPAAGWRVAAGRVQRRPSPFLPDTTPVRVVYDASLALPFGRRYSGHAGVHASPGVAGEGDSQGLNATVSGAPLAGVRGSLSFFWSRAPGGRTSSMASLSAYERIRADLEILQRVYYDGAGAPTLSLGGALVRGSTRVGVDYRTEFVPSAGGSQFRTALVLDVRLSLSPTTDLSVGTYLDSSGRASYRVRSGQWLYPAGAAAGGRGGIHAVDYEFQDHVVRGRVILEDGTPVEGAAVRLGERGVYTDARGRFMLRTEGRRSLSVEVLPSEFLFDPFYRVLRAPERVTSVSESESEEVTIVLQRISRRDATGR